MVTRYIFDRPLQKRVVGFQELIWFAPAASSNESLLIHAKLHGSSPDP